MFGQSTVEGRLIVPTRPDQFPLLLSHSYRLISLELALCEIQSGLVPVKFLD